MAGKNKKKTNKARKKIIKKATQILKHINYKDEKISRVLRNYGANLDCDNTFKLKPITCENIIENEEAESKEILQDSKPKIPKKKKRILNLVYFLLNILIIVVFMAVQLSGEENPKESLSEILNINWWFILAALGTFVLATILDQIRIAILIHKTTGALRINLAYKVTAIGRHYDTVTPLGTGGQPFQIIYMNKYGIKAGEGVSIAMGKYIINQIVFFFFITFFLFGNLFAQRNGTATTVVSGIATTLSWVGYILCAVVIIMVTFISFNKRAGAGLVAGVLKLASKIKIGKFRLIKDYNKSFKNIMKNVNIWQRTMRSYSKSVFVLIASIITSLLYFIVYYSMPFFLYCAFEGWHPDMWLQTVTFAVMIDLASAYNPIPMGIGTADISFTGLFVTLFSNKGALAWAQIIWRCLFYYIYILQGLCVLSYDYFFGARRLEKNKEFWMLPMKERLKIKLKNKQQNEQIKS